MSNETARERVADAIPDDARTQIQTLINNHDVDSYRASVGAEGGEYPDSNVTTQAIANAIWSRADDPEVVEAVAKADWESEFRHDNGYQPSDGSWGTCSESEYEDSKRRAREAITAALTALIGPRPQEGDSNEPSKD